MNINKDLILVPYHILPDGTREDWTDKFEHYGYRTTWKIIWTCVLTLFACTWVTIHPNIPPHRCSPAGLYYKIQLWVVTLIMPELLLLWASKQYFAARELTKNKEGGEESIHLCSNGQVYQTRRQVNWTMRQAFFALMGGCQDNEGRIISPYPRHNIKMPTDEEILDKNKEDYFVKFLAIAQILWFVMDTINRIQSPDLFATEVEILTFTFACLSAFTKGLWWYKPKGINLPLPCDPNPPSSRISQPCTGTSPNCLELATSILRFDRGNTKDHISSSDIYAYDGHASFQIPFLFTSVLGSLSGATHLIVASLNGGLATTRGRIWFVLGIAGSSLSFYLLIVTPICSVVSFVLNKLSKDSGLSNKGKWLNDLDLLNKYVVWVLLVVSVIGRISLIIVLIYFMFTPYDYRTFLTPRWSEYFPHPF